MFFRRSEASIRVLMVCMGNICRSPMAQHVLAHQVRQAGLRNDIAVDSAGTQAGHVGAAMDARAQRLLTARGYTSGKGRARKVVPEDFERFDLILAMDRANLADLREVCPKDLHHKLKLLLEFAPETGADEVPDPYYGAPQGFEHVLALCEVGCAGVLRHLQARGR